ncbi:hypothetical protein D3C87_2050120 [compost metagenome]
MARRAARRKSATVWRISSVVSARGSGMGCIPVMVNIGAPGAMAEGATGCR